MSYRDQPSPRLASRLSRLATAAFSLLTLLLLVCPQASAQLAGKGAISGKVADASGAAVPGATIVITKDATNLSVTTTSTSSGDYDVTTLDPGVYTVVITASGFQKLTQKNVTVNALETQTFDPKLTVGAATEEVTVSSAPPQLETSNATLGATLEQDMYSALPLEQGAYGQPDQRRATDFVFLFPGVQGNNTSGNATTNSGIVNGSGSRGAVTGTYVDGISFTRAGGNGDPRYVWTAISVDAIDQLQVQTVGYSAIYEGQGVQNYNVKQGGNKYHGTVYEFFRNTVLDTFGFFPVVSPTTQAITKPVEHSNEYGIALSGPLVPFTKLKDKLFFFGNYNGFRFINQKPTAITFPTAAEQAGNFQGLQTGGIFDPNTQGSCTANSTDGPCRYRYGYIAGTGTGVRGNPIINPATGAAGVDVIPAGQFSSVALKAQSFLPAGIGTSAQNNYIAPNRNGLTNWSTTDRIDFALSEKHSMSGLVAIGRQASSVPAGQTTAGRNVGPIPYNYGQTFTPKTAVGIVEDTYIFSPHLVNQLKYGYARYDGPTYDADQLPGFSATSLGVSGTPAGQASGAFPIVTFAGTNAPTGFAGVTANRVIAQNYTLLDNVQYVVGKHSITLGGQIAWLNYDQSPATGGSTPITLAAAVTETAALNSSGVGKPPTYAATSNTGLAYASFLIGQIDKTSYTQYLVQEFGSRFRAISPYIQDNWKISDKLTLDLGLRWDYFPPLRENKDDQSFFSDTVANPITGVNGGLQYAGNGPGTCNCSSPFQTSHKNFGPRLGLAYQVDPNTVVRASYGVMYTHGNSVGGSNQSVTGSAGNSLGFSASPTYSVGGTLLSTAPFTGTNGALPATTTVAIGRASGPQFGTGYTTTAGFTGTPSTISRYDPYLGSRAPQFINYSLGVQHQWTPAFVTTMTYVGSQGHFLLTDGTNPRGFYADQLDPKYLYLQGALSSASTQANCAANSLPCPANFTASKQISDALKPYPFQTVSDFNYNVGNTNYNSLQIIANMRASHHLTFMANYTWSRAIDDTGTFRSGYALPAGSVYNNPRAYAQDRIERTVSTSSQPHKGVITGVYDLPFGRDVLNSYAWERAAFGGFKFSEIFQVFSGSPLPIIGATCPVNPAQSTCEPSYNPTFTRNTARINGRHWGQGVTRTSYNSTSFIDQSAFKTDYTTYTFGNVARTQPYADLSGPGNYNLDIALVRSFKLHITEAARFDFRAELYNVTNHTQFQVSGNSLIVGNSSFGQVTGVQANSSRSAQLSGRISF